MSESWREILGPQAIDLTLLAAFVALALVSFFRKSVRLKYVTLAAAVGYMGFVKSRLVSIVDIFAVADWNLPILKYNLAWYALSIFVVASTALGLGVSEGEVTRHITHNKLTFLPLGPVPRASLEDLRARVGRPPQLPVLQTHRFQLAHHSGGGHLIEQLLPVGQGAREPAIGLGHHQRQVDLRLGAR